LRYSFKEFRKDQKKVPKLENLDERWCAITKRDSQTPAVRDCHRTSSRRADIV
jgi:hypothetical protein